MAWTAPRTWVASEVLTAALLNAHLRDNLNAAHPVGSLHFFMQAATTAATTIEGFALECNGTAVSRATYAALNTKLSGLSYPFGTGDGSTTMNLPDLQGRGLVAMASGGHADVNALGDSDALTKTSRSPKHNSTNGLSGSGGTLSGSPGLTGAPGVGSLALPNHVHTATAGAGSSATPPNFLGTNDVSGQTFNTGNPTSLPAITGAPSIGTLAATVGSLSVSGMSISGTIGPGGTRPTDTPAYLVPGVWGCKY